MSESLYGHFVDTEAVLREAVHIAKIGSWKWDLKHGETIWSDEMYEIFGIVKESVKGKLDDAIAKIIYPEDLPIFQDTVSVAQKKTFEYRIIHPDQSIHYILAKNGDVTFDESGNPSFLVGIVQDITEQKAAQLALITAKEKAESKNASKSHFFATMSHEFRTPINVLLSSIELFNLYVENEDLLNADKISKHLNSMKQSSLRLLRLVNNLIDISKLETGFYSPNFKNYNLVEIIEKIVLSVKDYAKQKNIDIEFRSELDQAVIKCDVDMIERIMLNLISNAIKFSSIDCLIQILIYKNNENLYISVKDNGIGIEEDSKDSIFERYMQFRTTLNRISEGSGIGLTLTKALVEMHKGQIFVKSEPGQGSEFIIRIPDIINEADKAETVRYVEKNDQGLVLKMNVEFSDIYV